jgi:AbrB family looped-hinge helix DNA binding protein
VTIAALGWRGGDRLTLTADAGVMVARRDPGGMVTVPARPYIVIPAALRRRFGLRAGDHVLLAAVSQRTAVEAALVLLERMGLSPADLVVAPRGRTSLMRRNVSAICHGSEAFVRSSVTPIDECHLPRTICHQDPGRCAEGMNGLVNVGCPGGNNERNPSQVSTISENR